MFIRRPLHHTHAHTPARLAGSDSSVPSTVEAQQNVRNTSDLLRRFRELGERMRQEYKAPPVLGEEEARLRVRAHQGCCCGPDMPPLGTRAANKCQCSPDVPGEESARGASPEGTEALRRIPTSRFP